MPQSGKVYIFSPKVGIIKPNDAKIVSEVKRLTIGFTNSIGLLINICLDWFYISSTNPRGVCVWLGDLRHVLITINFLCVKRKNLRPIKKFSCI